jgi:hypothetical protein
VRQRSFTHPRVLPKHRNRAAPETCGTPSLHPPPKPRQAL